MKALLSWVAALAGLSLVALLFLTGKGAAALYGLVLLGPLVWEYWQKHRTRAPAAFAPKMGRPEALAVLGLPPNPSESDIRASWVRLMRVVHPDSGGTDWLASRVNQAKDILLKH